MIRWTVYSAVVLVLSGSFALASPFVSGRSSVPVRTCASSVYGVLEKNWRRNPGTVVAGPVAFPNVFAQSASEPASTFAPLGGQYEGQKVLLVVAARTTVRLVIPPRDRLRLRLLYDPHSWDPSGRYRLAAGNVATIFHSCSDETQFNGGFIVAGPQCAHVLVYVARRRQPFAARLPFGRKCD
jgi:hypothetical protein